MKSKYFKGIIRILVFSGIILTALITCEKPERVVQFTTLEAQTADVSYTTATLKGEITDAGSKPIGDHGILISTDANPRVGNSTVKSLGSRSSKGVFSANVTDLTKNTTYYFRSYVTIEGVDTYAEKICSFTTKDTEAPTVTAGTISALTMTSASLNGEVTSDGGESAVTRGLCWDTEAGPTISDCIDTTKNGSGIGVFTGSMTDLTPGTQYYARTYAINSKGTSYNSADIVFTTHNLPVVTTASVTDITETTATSGGEVTDTGGVDVTARGVCWSTTTGPTVGLTTKTSDGPGEGTFVSSVTGLTQGTKYYLRAYATNQYGTSYGSETSFTTASSTDAPIAVTGAAGAVASTSALLQGTVNANGYSTTVTFEYGSTTSYGTEVAADQSPVTGTTETAVNVGVTELTASTTYHYRVKAVSTGGTTYGDDMEFTTASTLPTVTDYDGNTYNIITINTQDWIQENLKTTHYNNGEAIANITTDDTAWETLTTGAYCWYNNDEATYKNTYGALYNWYTTVDVRNVCPAGWHVPSDAEWTTLVDYLGGVNNAGALLKETGTTHWTDPNSGATNESYFTALPGGQRRYDGPFSELGDEGYWWTSTVYSTTSAWWRLMEYNNTQANHYASNNNFGFSVRCIKGELPLTKIGDATTIAATSATLNGQVNPNNASTTVTFEYGLTDSYGSEVTASESPVTGSTPASVSADISSLSETTTYHYRVKAVNSYGTTYSADMTFTTLTLTAPTATTGSATSVTSSSATLNGTVNANDLSTTVTFEYGLTTTYGTEVTAAESPVTGTTATAVSYNLSSLTASTTYHYRVKAVSTGGTTYGDDMEFTTAAALPTVSDYDGNEYNIITIGTQDWIQENLKTTHYNNGDAIENITGNTEWSGLTTGAYCWYDNDEGTYKDTYGALYNWYTTVDVRNVCPAGWHVPTDDEWTFLTDYLGGTSVAGGKLKETGTSHWDSPNDGATNETGFTALPGGYRFSDGIFHNLGEAGYWWSSTEDLFTDAWERYMGSGYSMVVRSSSTKEIGMSVRCIKGELPLAQPEEATSVTAISATLNGQVNPNNASTTVTFEYGETTSYGSEETASESPATGTTPVSVSAGISGLSEATTYHYRVKAVNSYGTTYSTDMTFTTLTPPTATTGSATSITGISAILDGIVNANNLSTTVTFEYGLTDSYGSEVTANESPVTGSTNTAVTGDLSSLTASTTYHYRVKAVSTGGTTYGDDMEFTTASALPTVSDYDGNTYNIITIGTQEWIQENLKTTHYNNGEIIPNVTGNTEWEALTSGAYCWYDNDEGTYKDTYGALYNWYTTVNVRNVCPAGWHVPTDAEWTTMESYLIANGYNYDGTTTGNKIAKALASTTFWTSSTNTGAVGNTDYPAKRNISGFTALPSGSRNFDGSFYFIGLDGSWWSVSESSTSNAWIRYIYYDYTNVSSYGYNKQRGHSVRCVRGELPLAQPEDATSVTAISATLNGQVNPNNASTTVTFEYGETTSYGSEVTASESPVTGTTPVSVSAGISSLSESTTYHYRVKAVNSYGTSYSEDMTFTTLTPPTATTGSATSITGTSATLDGTVNANDLSTTVTFEYGETTAYGSEVTANESPVSGSTNTAVTGDLSSLTASTTYHYRVKAVSVGGTTYGDDMTVTTLSLPAVTTGSATRISSIFATLNGTVNANDLSTTVTFEYGLTTGYGSEVTADESPVTGTTSTTVSYDLTGLTASTTYHYRVKAVSSGGTTYGDDMTFTTTEQVTDEDGNTYNTVQIGTQLWTMENLKTTHYNDETSIPLVTDNTEWSNLTTPGYCWYDNDEATYGDTYGALYNWYTVNTGNLCPAGWHVPTDAEWTTMEDYLIANGYNYDGTTTGNLIAKALASTTLWNSSTNTGAVGNTDYPAKRNATGFTALPGGYRHPNGNYSTIGYYGYWWSSTEYISPNYAWIRYLDYDGSPVVRYFSDKPSGFSVRCLRD